MSISLKRYLRDIGKVYTTCGAEVAESNDELRDLRQAMHDVRNSDQYTPAGKAARLQKLEARETELKAKQEALRKKADQQAAEIRQNVEQVFYNYFHANAADVDLKTMELLKAGVMTETELLRMARDANATMKRIIGKQLAGSDDPEVAAAGRVLSAAPVDPHLQAVDAMIGLGKYAAGGAPLSGAGVARRIVDRWEELSAPIMSAAPPVAFEFGEGGAIVYTEGE